MVPSAFVILGSIPRTSSGKLDRRALALAEQDLNETRPYEAPQGEVEQALGTLWQQLLKLPRIGRNDNFFELGGHSLLAMRLAAEVPELAVGAVFSGPTIQLMAQNIESISPENLRRWVSAQHRGFEEGAI